MTLSDSQKQEFVENGFVVIRNAVPAEFMNKAVHAINHAIGEGIRGADEPSMQDGRYFPGLTTSPAITDLVNATGLHSMAESVVGKGTLPLAEYGQIALRFPVVAEESPRMRWHLDGKWGIDQPVPVEEMGANFTLLVGVLLSDVPTEFAGNFTVWPTTHHLYAAHFREHGPEAFSQGKSEVDSPEPLQITGSAGDVILSHYLLAHCGGPNLSPHIRYAAFFRMKNRHRDTYKLETLTDTWVDFPCLQARVG